MAFVRYHLISAVLYVCFEKRSAILKQFKNNKNEHGPKNIKEHLEKLGFLSLETYLVCNTAAKRIISFLISVLNRNQGKGYGTILKAC